MQFVLQNHIAGDKGAEDLGLDGITLYLQGGTDGMQRIGARELGLELVHGEVDVAVPTHAVQRIGVVLGGAFHAVVDGDAAAALWYAVQGAVLRTVIEVIILVRLCLELVLAVVAEYGVAHRIGDDGCSFDVVCTAFNIERYLFIAALIETANLHRFLAIAILRQTVEQLLHVNFDRRMVDAVISSVVTNGISVR